MNIRDPGLRGAWTATRASDTAGRPAAPAPRGRGRVAEECRRRHVARESKRPRFFLCPWWQRSKRRGVAAGSRGAPQRACALLSCDAHCVCVPGAGLRTARTGQQGLAGLAEARLQRCLRRKSRLVVTRAQGSGGGSGSVNCTAALPEPPAHREPLQAHLSELCPTPSPAQRRAQEPGSSGGALCG